MRSHYADTPRETCFHYEGAYEGILFLDIEVKVRSEKYLAKYTAVVWGNDTYF